jgi:hypothetical protein
MHYTLRTETIRDLLLHWRLMDLLKTEQLNGEQWNKAKLGALLCFAVACALLAASLLMPRSAEVGGDSRLTTGSVLQSR